MDGMSGSTVAGNSTKMTARRTDHNISKEAEYIQGKC